MQDLKSVGPQLKLYTGVGVTPQLCCVNKCVKVLIEPMNNPLCVSPSKGKQGTTRGNEKVF